MLKLESRKYFLLHLEVYLGLFVAVATARGRNFIPQHHDAIIYSDTSTCDGEK